MEHSAVVTKIENMLSTPIVIDIQEQHELISLVDILKLLEDSSLKWIVK
jgi:hypothetical protein